VADALNILNSVFVFSMWQSWCNGCVRFSELMDPSIIKAQQVEDYEDNRQSEFTHALLTAAQGSH